MTKLKFQFRPDRVIPDTHLIIEVILYTISAFIVDHLLKFSGFEETLEKYPLFIELFIFVFGVIYIKSLIDITIGNHEFK